MATTRKWTHHRPAIATRNNTIRLKEQLGQEVPMICAKGKQLKFCMFTEPDSDNAINIDPETMKLFSGPLQPIKIHPDNESCGILIPKIKQEHKGTWRCQVYKEVDKLKGTGTTWHGKPFARVNKFFEIELLPSQTQEMQNTTDRPNTINHQAVSIVTITFVMALVAAFTLILKRPKGNTQGYRIL